MDISKNINQFMEGSGRNKGRRPKERYASFDYCYNYFFSFYKNGRIAELASDKNIQLSCLQLGFYLASWGMLRGRAFLLEKSVRNLEDLIIAISKMPPKMWEIDVDNYDEQNIKLLLGCKEKIIDALGRNNAKTWDTLATKVMLGVFGNIPAFDRYFKNSLNLGSVNKKALFKIKDFYDANSLDFDSFKIYTYDFLSGQETKNIYTKAKLIDMCGFMGGQ
jgi:hypothetical protein